MNRRIFKYSINSTNRIRERDNSRIANSGEDNLNNNNSNSRREIPHWGSRSKIWRGSINSKLGRRRCRRYHLRRFPPSEISFFLVGFRV